MVSGWKLVTKTLLNLPIVKLLNFNGIIRLICKMWDHNSWKWRNGKIAINKGHGFVVSW